ncbi:MAG: glycosyltransferase [Candidatus Babeliales bacterium]|jgi:hypothetical protein
MIIGLPVVEGHELTKVALDHLTKNAVMSTTIPVVIDNGSATPYNCDPPFEICKEINGYKVGLISNKENIGYYQPLKQLYDQYPDEQYIGLMHNDLMLYEQGWDRRMLQAFEEDPELGLIGLCGSREVDERGGRGGHTVCNFMGRDVLVGEQVWHGQDPSAGRRIEGIEPAIVLDSLFMLFRREAIPSLVRDHEDWDDITLAHFYDRIWPIRVIEDGWHVITMGSDNDHIGGMTTTGNERYRNDCIKFLDERGIPYDNPETEMYLVAERRYLEEYRDQKHWLPAIIREGYNVTHLA